MREGGGGGREGGKEGRKRREFSMNQSKTEKLIHVTVNQFVLNI